MTNQYQSAQLQELDALHHLHPFTTHSSLRAAGARVIVRGDGPYIWDSEGKRILDGMAGLWTCNVGYGRKALAQAAYDQMVELPFYNTFFKTTHPPVVALSRKLAELAPDNLNQVFYGSSGSESNDTAIRLIRHYWVLKGEPKRRIIISRKNAYHGSTIAAGSMGGMAHVHAHSYPVYEGFRHIMDPYWYGESEEGETPEAFGLRAARALEDEILAVGPENVAAFAGEPVQGAGGVKIPPAELLARGATHRRQIRHPSPCRRGDHRLRPPRHLVRIAVLRHPPQPHHLRQGGDVGLHPALRRHRRRQDRRRADGPRRTTSITATPSRVTPWPAPWR